MHSDDEDFDLIAGSIKLIKVIHSREHFFADCFSIF